MLAAECCLAHISVRWPLLRLFRVCFFVVFLVSSVIIVKSDLGYIGRGSRHEFLWFRTY